MHKHKFGKKKHHHHPHGHGMGHGEHHPRMPHDGHHGRILNALSGQLNEGEMSPHIRREGLRRQGTGIIPQIDLHRCKACGKCQRVCPSSAIRVEYEIAKINVRLCKGCGACIDACPTGALAF